MECAPKLTEMGLKYFSANILTSGYSDYKNIVKFFNTKKVHLKTHATARGVGKNTQNRFPKVGIFI